MLKLLMNHMRLQRLTLVTSKADNEMIQPLRAIHFLKIAYTVHWKYCRYFSYLFPPILMQSKVYIWCSAYFCQKNWQKCWSIKWSKECWIYMVDIKVKKSLFKQQTYNVCAVVTYPKLLRMWCSVIWSYNFLNS